MTTIRLSAATTKLGYTLLMTHGNERMRRHIVLALCGIAIACCGGCSLLRGDGDESSPPGANVDQRQPPAPSAGPTSPDVPGQPPNPPGGGSKQLVIQPGSGLSGGMQVTSGGRAVWPPQGPGCDNLVACCTAASATESATSLFCQMAVATEPVNCTKALQDVRSYLAERGQTAPPQCAQ